MKNFLEGLSDVMDFWGDFWNFVKHLWVVNNFCGIRNSFSEFWGVKRPSDFNFNLLGFYIQTFRNSSFNIYKFLL